MYVCVVLTLGIGAAEDYFPVRIHAIYLFILTQESSVLILHISFKLVFAYLMMLLSCRAEVSMMPWSSGLIKIVKNYC